MTITRGSEWRRWDLHLHTASSYDYKYKGNDADEILCKTLHDNNIAAVAITDHFKIDATRIRHLRSIAPDIVFFPGVELRTDKGANNLHFIMIFSDRLDLDILSADFDAWRRDKAKEPTSDERIHWTFEDALKFAHRHEALITIHAGRKTNGIGTEITSAYPYKDAIKDDIAKNIHFFEVGQKRDEDEYRLHVLPSTGEKPIIICSDNHNPRNYTVNEKLWIKADLTFEGLKQCIYQPRERVYLGTIPPALDRENKNKRNNIDKIEVHRIGNPNHSQVKWFDFELPLSKGLVAIIGNKGSGKSALSDIIGQLCKCTTMNKAAFLNDRRFRKSPNNYASDYVASITWADGHEEKEALDVSNYGTVIENAQYLPQQYIEDVCNDMGAEFQNEIDRVIFSYVDDTERGDAKNLEELVANRSSAISISMEGIKKKISDINKKIIKLEEKKTSYYCKTISDNLRKLKEDLARHDNSKPKEVKKPNSSEDNEAYQKKLALINRKIGDAQDKLRRVRQELTLINQDIEETKNVIATIENINQEVDAAQEIVDIFFSKRDISGVDYKLELKSPIQALQDYLADLKKRREEQINLINGSESIIGLEAILKSANDEKEQLIETADINERTYQKYLTDLSEWEKERLRIIGNQNEEGSLTYFDKELDYLNNQIDNDYDTAKRDRNELLAELFSCVENLAKVYREIYSPVETEIDNLLGKLEDRVVFGAEIQLRDNSFIENVLSYINQRQAGIFKGKQNAHNKMEEFVKGTDFTNKDSLNKMLVNIMEAVYEDIDKSSQKISDKQAFYDYLYSLAYIGVSFKLKVGERNLEELSPGERGIVLLIFYLALNKNSTPIIIDQPEDNLDNQSVYSKLVPCICAAKQRRQVIIVTHNPNIAVACDAEQIIYCAMDKNKHRFSYSAGAIENNETKQHVIDVLEGTMPAFDLRRRKYTMAE